MGDELFRLVHSDPSEPRAAAAMADARDAERVIDTLTELRATRRLSQSDVATSMETTQSTVSKFERAGGDPHLSTLQRYARAVGARLRLMVVATGEESASWQAHHQIPTSVEPEPDALGDSADPVDAMAAPVIRLAS